MTAKVRRVGRLYYRRGLGFRYLTVWTATPPARLQALRGPFPTVEDCRADLRRIS